MMETMSMSKESGIRSSAGCCATSDQRPSLPPFAARLYQDEPGTDSLRPNAPLAHSAMPTNKGKEVKASSTARLFFPGYAAPVRDSRSFRGALFVRCFSNLRSRLRCPSTSRRPDSPARR